MESFIHRNARLRSGSKRIADKAIRDLKIVFVIAVAFVLILVIVHLASNRAAQTDPNYCVTQLIKKNHLSSATINPGDRIVLLNGKQRLVQSGDMLSKFC